MQQARSRRDEYSETTRRALLESAAHLFAEKGFTATSLDEVAADARVTKGAVYHHFPNKQAVFAAVADLAEAEVAAQIAAAAAEAGTAWEGAIAGWDCFLERCLDPLYRRLCFEEGPAVMGFANWWEHGERHNMPMIRSMLAALHGDGLIESGDLDALTELLFGTAIACALAIARADDPKAESQRVREATIRLVAGLRPPNVPIPDKRATGRTRTRNRSPRSR